MSQATIIHTRRSSFFGEMLIGAAITTAIAAGWWAFTKVTSPEPGAPSPVAVAMGRGVKQQSGTVSAAPATRADARTSRRASAGTVQAQPDAALPSAESISNGPDATTGPQTGAPRAR